MARSMSKPFSHFPVTYFANLPTPPFTYTFVDRPPPLIGEEKLLLGVKIASAIVVLMIFTVVLIVKLRECRSHSSCGGSVSEGGGSVSEGDGVTNSQIIIQLPALNTDDGSVLASG
ncbi:methionine--trna ligase, chloroplastic/mitochondrial [Fagus crenata]